MEDGIITPCNVAGNSGITCHGIRPNVRHVGILLLVSIFTISHQSTCHRNFIQIRRQKNDVMSIFKMADHSHLQF